MPTPNPTTTRWLPFGASGGLPTVVNGQWLKGSGGAAVWAAITPADVANIPYGTSLPASPFDGQEAILVDSVTNPSYQWRFRFNAGSSSAYKWEFIGGAAAFNLFATAETPLSVSAWTWCQTPGPDITVARAGDYFVRVGAALSFPSQGLVSVSALTVGQGAPPATMGQTSDSAPNGLYGGALAEGRILAVAAAATFRLVVNSSVGNATIGQRTITITPIRVS